MPHRTRAWVWAGRAVASAAVLGMAMYLAAVGLDQAGRIAAPAGLVIALAAFFAPYLLPVYQPSDPPSAASDPAPPGGGSIVNIADHGSVIAQHIHEITMNPSSRGVPERPTDQ